MVSASSDKPAVDFDRMAFIDELMRSVLLDINCQVDDTPESTTADGYKAHLGHLNKLLMCATKVLFLNRYVYFFY